MAPMTVREDNLQLKTTADTAVEVRQFHGSKIERVVVVAGALAVPQRFYRSVARYLAQHGAAVWTFDYRGLGRLARGHPARAEHWIRDLDTVVTAAFESYPGVPVSVLAHSFGGQVLPLAKRAVDVERVVAVGTGFALPRRWTGWDRIRMDIIVRILLPIVPRFFGFLPGWMGLGHDVPAGVAIDWARWCRSERYLLDNVRGAEAAYARLTAPVEVLAIEDDDYAPRLAVEAYARELPRATIRPLRPAEAGVHQLGHFGPFRTSASALWEQWSHSLGLAWR